MKMKVWKCRYHSRVYIGFSVVFLLILLIYFRIFEQNNSDESNSDQTKNCDQTIIQQYFMKDKRYFK
jgi:uncharacterized membrane protein affecting hemolysin expression